LFRPCYNKVFVKPKAKAKRQLAKIKKQANKTAQPKPPKVEIKQEELEQELSN
jgi:hypothetical protein